MATMTEQHEADPGDRFAGARRFPRTLPAPGTGGGAELGEPVQLYSNETRPFPTPNPGPVSAPPVVASGLGNRGPGWLLRGRRGEGDG